MTQPTLTWPAKDPDARQDFLYTIPLDADDAVASYVLASVSGVAVIDTESRSGADVTVWISGGADAEINEFRFEWVTVAGREDDQTVLLPIVASEPATLTLTGYAKPNAAHLVQRYSNFADVPPATIAYWLTDGERYVTTSWIEGDYAAGLMAIAAHHLALAGHGVTADVTAGIPAGVTAMKSADMSLTFDAEMVRSRADGGLGSTRYGLEFARLRRINRGGPRVMGTGTLPYDPRTYPHGQA